MIKLVRATLYDSELNLLSAMILYCGNLASSTMTHHITSEHNRLRYSTHTSYAVDSELYYTTPLSTTQYNTTLHYTALLHANIPKHEEFLSEPIKVGRVHLVSLMQHSSKTYIPIRKAARGGGKTCNKVKKVRLQIEFKRK